MTIYISTALERDTCWSVTQSFCDLSTRSDSTQPPARQRNGDTFKVTKKKPGKENKRHPRAGSSQQVPRFTLALLQSGVVGSALNTTVTIKKSSPETITHTPAIVPETPEVIVIPCTQYSPHPVPHGDELHSSESTMTEFVEAIAVSREVSRYLGQEPRMASADIVPNIQETPRQGVNGPWKVTMTIDYGS